MKPEELRRLLELAAKAAGMNDWQWREESQAPAHYNTAMACFYRDYAGDAITWNPADDDGDGARMEASISLDVYWDNDAVCIWRSDIRIHCREYFDKHNGDKQAARRAASLRAAAAIGEAMP